MIPHRIEKLFAFFSVHRDASFNADDVFAYLNDRNIPADEVTLMNIIEFLQK